MGTGRPCRAVYGARGLQELGFAKSSELGVRKIGGCKAESGGLHGGAVTCFGELQGAGSCFGVRWGDCKRTGQDSSVAMGRVEGLEQGGGVCRRLGCCGGWSCAQLPSPGAQGLGLHLSSHKTTGTALNLPCAHPSLALECPPPCWASVGLQGQLRAGNTGGTLPDSGAGQRCTSGCLAGPSCPQLGYSVQIFPPQVLLQRCCLPVQREHNPRQFPCEFPGEFPCEPWPCLCV